MHFQDFLLYFLNMVFEQLDSSSCSHLHNVSGQSYPQGENMCRCHFVHLLEKRTLQGCRSSLAKTRAEKHDGKDNNIVTSNFVSDGNYLLGGHTTAGVTNWDYLAIKVSKSI